MLTQSVTFNLMLQNASTTGVSDTMIRHSFVQTSTTRSSLTEEDVSRNFQLTVGRSSNYYSRDFELIQTMNDQFRIYCDTGKASQQLIYLTEANDLREQLQESVRVRYRADMLHYKLPHPLPSLLRDLDMDLRLGDWGLLRFTSPISDGFFVVWATSNGTPCCSTHTWKDITGERYDSHNDNGMHWNAVKYTHDWFKNAIEHAERLWYSAHPQGARSPFHSTEPYAMGIDWMQNHNRAREEFIDSWIPYLAGFAAIGSTPTPVPDPDDRQPLLKRKQAYARSDKDNDSQHSNSYYDMSGEGKKGSANYAATDVGGSSPVASENEAIEYSDLADSIAANSEAVSHWAGSEVQDDADGGDGSDTRGEKAFTIWAARPEAHVKTVQFMGRQCYQISISWVWQEYPGNEWTRQAFRRLAKLPDKED
jgi:hypothetical protein